jgi:scyllo-inosose 3-dehydrogenase
MKALVLEADWDPRPPYVPSPAEIANRKATIASEVWRHPRLTLTTVPDPEFGPHEVLIRVRAVGVCGSDTHCLETDPEGYILFSGPTSLPVILGHEYAGEVVAVGSAVRDLAPGHLVACEGMLYCGVCEACRRGQPNQCPRLEMVGFSAPGAYAELITAHEKHCFRVDGLAERYGDVQLGLEIAALIEPIACPFNGMFVAAGGMLPGSHVAVYGCGPIGLGAVLLARAAGAASIAAFDISPERCELALAMGADVAHDPRALAAQGGSPAEVVRELTGGWGADMQIEAAGAAHATMPEIERSFAPAGKMVYLGRTGLEPPVMLDVLMSLASSITGARGHAGGGCFPGVIRMIERGIIDPAPMITARTPFDGVVAAIERSCLRTDGKIMVQV